MQKVRMPRNEAELNAFDQLPQPLRNVLNYTDECIDPRYILGMYKNQGLRNTLDYLDAIGMLHMEDSCIAGVYG